MGIHDDRSFQMFLKYEQSTGICACLLELCKDFEFTQLNNIKFHLEAIQKGLNQCSKLMSDIGTDQYFFSHIELFKVYKTLNEANETFWEGLEGINPEEYEGSILQENITNTAFALLDLITGLVNSTSDLLENPPIQEAA